MALAEGQEPTETDAGMSVAPVTPAVPRIEKWICRWPLLHVIEPIRPASGGADADASCRTWCGGEAMKGSGMIGTGALLLGMVAACGPASAPDALETVVGCVTGGRDELVLTDLDAAGPTCHIR